MDNKVTWKSFVALDTQHRNCDKGYYDVTNSKHAVGRQVKALMQHQTRNTAKGNPWERQASLCKLERSHWCNTRTWASIKSSDAASKRNTAKNNK